MKMDEIGDLVKDKWGCWIVINCIVDVDDSDELVSKGNVKLMGIDEDGDVREGCLVFDSRSGIWLRLWKCNDVDDYELECWEKERYNN
jgi:hypothetical protein